MVRHVLGGVAEALHLDVETLEDIRLAVSEACANVVIHAYAGEASGLMDVDVATGGGDLEVVVRDRGTGMAPRTDSPGLGVGLPLIASLAESMELLSPPGGGTEVRMRFALPPAGKPASAAALATLHPTGAAGRHGHGRRR